jgi:hypothetical protein
MLPGMISIKWGQVQCEHKNDDNDDNKWANNLTSQCLKLHNSIWEQRNSVIHGNTIQDAREKRETKSNTDKGNIGKPS